MCTTGVFRLADGRHAIFKNKDFGRTRLDDLCWVDEERFGVMGMTTWAATGDEPDRHSGFSIGANRQGLLCCDSNVATLDGFRNYDDLTAIALSAGGGVPDAIAAIREVCSVDEVSWANLVMIDGRTAAAVEVRGDRVEVTELDGPTARSNHHVRLGWHELQEDAATTHERLASAQRRIEEVRSVDDVFELLASHDDGDSGVCNHSDLTTVYSYVLVVGESTELHVLQGRPCSGAERVSLTVPFASPTSAVVDGFLAAYPSDDSRNAASVSAQPWVG
ncbi:MAG: hypothetical protein RLZZ01_970 [Actinomycetota bacterium]